MNTALVRCRHLLRLDVDGRQFLAQVWLDFCEVCVISPRLVGRVGDLALMKLAAGLAQEPGQVAMSKMRADAYKSEGEVCGGRHKIRQLPCSSVAVGSRYDDAVWA